MRVLYSFPHTLSKGGISTTARNQILALHQLGVDLVVFCTNLGTTRLPADIKVVQTLTVGGRRIPHRAFGVQRAYDLHDRLVARHVSRNRRSYDIVHAWPRACEMTLTSAAKGGTPGLREAPSPYTAGAVHQAQLAARSLGLSLPADHSHAVAPTVLAREEREFQAARFILVPSTYARQTFLEAGYPESTLLGHRYGCDLDTFYPPSPPRSTDRELRAIFVGRGEPNKGLHIALRAWREAGLAARGRFDICGAVLPDYAAYLAQDFSMPAVTLHGHVSDVADRMREADVLLLPSWTEGSALVSIEAQATGCIPLVSDATGSQARDGIEGMLHPVADTAMLARQLRRIADDAELRARLSSNCVAGRAELSWLTAGRALLAAYHQARQAN